MLVYRICLEKWSHKLAPSGAAARWNSKGIQVIYTAASRSLACLENLVHRSGEGINAEFRILTINVPDKLEISEVNLDALSANWREYSNNITCRDIGDSWISKCEAVILKVPSAIIPEESNYLLNPNHSDFKLIKVKNIENFKFDQRIKL